MKVLIIKHKDDLFEVATDSYQSITLRLDKELKVTLRDSSSATIEFMPKLVEVERKAPQKVTHKKGDTETITYEEWVAKVKEILSHQEEVSEDVYVWESKEYKEAHERLTSYTSIYSEETIEYHPIEVEYSETYEIPLEYKPFIKAIRHYGKATKRVFVYERNPDLLIRIVAKKYGFTELKKDEKTDGKHFSLSGEYTKVNGKYFTNTFKYVYSGHKHIEGELENLQASIDNTKQAVASIFKQELAVLDNKPLSNQTRALVIESLQKIKKRLYEISPMKNSRIDYDVATKEINELLKKLIDD